MYVCMCVCMYKYICMYIHVYIYKHIYMCETLPPHPHHINFLSLLTMSLLSRPVIN